ncbi:hypothetical protein X732_30385 [Mesorhizobium sp. L2C066B000]|nr:hypothetical protein X732_30385 [Mesorhizobium sp. L2C066B000]
MRPFFVPLRRLSATRKPGYTPAKGMLMFERILPFFLLGWPYCWAAAARTAMMVR